MGACLPSPWSSHSPTSPTSYRILLFFNKWWNFKGTSNSVLITRNSYQQHHFSRILIISIFSLFLHKIWKSMDYDFFSPWREIYVHSFIRNRHLAFHFKVYVYLCFYFFCNVLAREFFYEKLFIFVITRRVQLKW